MKKYVLFWVWCVSLSTIQAQDTLQLKTMFQPEYHRSFELSGLAQNAEGKIFMVNDDQQKIYYLDQQKIIASEKTAGWKLKYKENDWEAIDMWKNQPIILSENAHTIIGNNFRLRPDFLAYKARTKQDLHPEKWGNAGFEGFCFGDSTLFFAKERSSKGLQDGCYILEVNQKGQILRKFTLPKISRLAHRNPDLTDLKYIRKNGEDFLYILERNYYLVTRLNLRTNQVVRLSYAKYTADQQLNNRLYHTKKPQYGMAEALMITDDEIWIGFDNNGSSMNTHYFYAQKYHLKGNQCTIMVFDRGDF